MLTSASLTGRWVNADVTSLIGRWVNADVP